MPEASFDGKKATAKLGLSGSRTDSNYSVLRFWHGVHQLVSPKKEVIPATQVSARCNVRDHAVSVEGVLL